MESSSLDLAIRFTSAPEFGSLLKGTVGALDVGILITDLDHRSLAVNARFGEIWDVDPAAIVQSDVETVREMVQKRVPDFEAWQANLEAIYLQPDLVQEDDFRLINPIQIVRRKTVPILDSNGRVQARLWTFLDITRDQKRARISRILSETSMLFDAEPRLVYDRITQSIADFYGSLCLLSLRAGDFLRFEAMSGPGEDTARAMGGNKVEDSFCQFCFHTRHSVVIQDSRQDPRYAALLPTGMGLTRYLGVPVHDPEGRPIGTVCILDGRSDEPLDDDDVRLMELLAMRIGSELDREAKLHRLNQALEATSSELQDIRQEFLQQEKLATAGRLSASIAHDIRNILSAVSLEVEMGRDSPADALDRVKDHLDRFHLLSHQLLSYVKPTHVALEPASIPDSLERVTSLLARTLEVGGIELDLEIDRGMEPICADPNRLDHMFVNLMLNAIQAMDGGGRLVVKAEMEGVVTRVSISDTGKGLSQSQMEQLFEPFASRRRGGFGLGLYSVKRILEESSGTMFIESEPSIGSTITLAWRRPCPSES